MNTSVQHSIAEVNRSGRQISDIPRFLWESGLLFRMNVGILHPVGYALVVQAITGPKGEHKLILELRDHTDNPTVVLSPEAFDNGRNKWMNFLKRVGNKSLNIRKKRLGFSVQHQG